MKLGKFVLKVVSLFFDPEIKVVDLIHHTFVLDVGLHPVWLTLVYVPVPNEWLFDYTVFRENLAVEPLVILINDELRVAKVVFEGVKTIIRTFVIAARHKVDV
jgi:hypothetical protein